MFEDEPKPDGAQPDPVVPESSADRADRALDLWNKPDETAPDAAKPDAAAAALEPKSDAPKPEDAPKPDAAKPDAAAADDITKAPFFNDPAFQKYHAKAEENSQVVAGFREIFDNGAYAIKDDATLKAVHADAFMLYDIASGKKTASELMDVFKANWTPEQFKLVLNDLAAYAVKEGIKLEEAKPETPLEKDVRLMKERDTQRETTAASEKVEKQRVAIVDSFTKKVTELCVAQGFDPKNKEDREEIDEYCLQLSSAIGRDPKLREQLEKGQFGETVRLFTEHHNRMLARAARLGNKTLDAKRQKDKVIPKTPAGDAPPLPAGDAPPLPAGGGKRRDLKTSEGRTTAAKELWDAGKTA